MIRVKKMCVGIISLFGITITLSSCSSNDQVIEEESVIIKASSHRITAEQAKQNALDFIVQFNNAAKTRCETPQISEIIAIGSKSISTRTANDSTIKDTISYVVNFANNEGFVIAASDDRMNTILAYIDEGNYDEFDATNPEVNDYLEKVEKFEMNLKADEDPINMPREDDESLYAPDVFTIMKPLLVTKWGQYKYGKYCPNGITGCVMTAVSQICSFLEYPLNVQWFDNENSKLCSIEWDRINEECTQNSGNVLSTDLADQISQLMYFWGLEFNADYYTTEGLTLATSNVAINKLQELGYNASNLKKFNAESIREDLNSGNKIIYISGREKSANIGHAWVVDGYIYTRIRDVESIYVHCNWGWTSGNGYYLSSILDTNEKVYYDDGTAVTRSNYNDQLKTSTICK
jgi:hypothetical protein